MLLIDSFNRFKSLLLLDNIVFASLLQHPEMIMERLGRHYMVVLIFWIQIRAFKDLWNRMVHKENQTAFYLHGTIQLENMESSAVHSKMFLVTIVPKNL